MKRENMKAIITDPDHEWYGKKVVVIYSIPKTRTMNIYIVRLAEGTKDERQYEESVLGSQWERIE